MQDAVLVDSEFDIVDDFWDDLEYIVGLGRLSILWTIHLGEKYIEVNQIGFGFSKTILISHEY
jgi:hypothetical protein